ncbi:PREDICTED: delta(3,5)-Delta(2,4)-dienoyl-CoA isomerase, mitochondrial-like [Amphimedon queenslandica]|uniref:Delta(3,5)-Delta(2,4)-dienoyl-CoA isomerase, mitochondrial n=2 Tax=Amphimedon queenslandica TaxID=400682 RepID=A0AAN0ICZ8_AMPQE|nr:PREDICTED: delta(3,5)-Delta(2,4)-dienoyl-CoA isomerase, mitochondrial-like [Amphimedon queenslandica]|eukprot:XP_003385723.3 PREDICTED: delta(3,5)-Delta(2,4)-dienoyl-CoA isomerase, mitochondrial-like [Amphimedon queenslandica]
MSATRILSSLSKVFYPASIRVSAMSTAGETNALPEYETLSLSSPQEYVVQVELNRPERRNAMNKTFFREMIECFAALNKDSNCRSIVLSGAGKSFTAGLDLNDAASDLFSSEHQSDPGRQAFNFRENFLMPYQQSITCVEKCKKPVIVAVHGACVGGGIDLITACDIRLCSSDTFFQIKEVDIGLAADIGTLQRLPKIVGCESLVRELVFTARKFSSEEAVAMKLVSHVYPDRPALIEAAVKMASLIASKSPVAVQVSKINLNYSRDHTVDESLDYMATWNMCMLQSEDLLKAVQGQLQKETPKFSKL